MRLSEAEVLWASPLQIGDLLLLAELVHLSLPQRQHQPLHLRLGLPRFLPVAGHFLLQEPQTIRDVRTLPARFFCVLGLRENSQMVLVKHGFRDLS